MNSSVLTPPVLFAGALRSLTRKKVAKYPPDKTVDVYYNPQSLEKVCLEPGVPLVSYISFFAVMIFLIVSFVVIVSLLP
ncbi:MAG: DUF3592 domain-containing protein [Candidatus Hodarchaeales archaeon]